MRYLLEPEVSGELGERSIVDPRVHPPRIEHLHFVITGWLGDDIIECFPCYIITKRLKDILLLQGFTGFVVANLELTVSEQFSLLQPNTELPQLFWLKIFGLEQSSDFSLNQENVLSVSERAFEVLEKFTINGCDVERAT